MRVIFDGRSLSDDGGGLRRFSYGFARALSASRRVEGITILTKNGARHEDIGDLGAATLIGFGLDGDAREEQASWASALASHRADVVVSPFHVRGPWASPRPVVVVAHDFIWRGHGLAPGRDFRRGREEASRRALARADSVIVLSQTVRDVVEREWPSAPCLVIRPPVSEAIVGLESRSGGRPVLAVSSLRPHKNVTFVLGVCDRLARRGIQSTVVLRSAPEFGDAVVHAAPGDVEILTTLADDELGQRLQSSRVVLCASLDEGYDLPLHEALANGSHVVASPIPVHWEVAHEPGITVVALEADAWVQAVEELVQVTPESAVTTPSQAGWSRYVAAVERAARR